MTKIRKYTDYLKPDRFDSLHIQPSKWELIMIQHITYSLQQFNCLYIIALAKSVNKKKDSYEGDLSRHLHPGKLNKNDKLISQFTIDLTKQDKNWNHLLRYSKFIMKVWTSTADLTHTVLTLHQYNIFWTCFNPITSEKILRKLVI